MRPRRATRSSRPGFVAAAVLVIASAAAAQPPQPNVLPPGMPAVPVPAPDTSRAPTLTLEASARASVANDEMIVTLASQRDGTELAALNEAVLAELNSAIAEAKAVEGVRARLGSVWTQPNFDRDGRRVGWRVRGEVVLESRELPALSRLAGKLAERMQLGGVSFRLSDERRKLEERRLLKQAADAFAARARDAAAAFGFSDYRLRGLTLGGSAPIPPPRPMAMRAATMEAAATVPAEGGDSEVVVTVWGVVELQ